MAVFTNVPFEEAAVMVRRLGLGALRRIAPCPGGIENTNYFVEAERGDYVLTLFERLSWKQVPFYLHLMQHLAARSIPVPRPVADRDGRILHWLEGKPAALVGKLSGRSELAPQVWHCRHVGTMLARMHLAGRDYPQQQANLRGLSWWKETVPTVLPHIGEEQRQLLRNELDFQIVVAGSPEYATLPRGPVHADLFRDNVLFDGGRLCGFLDFYFAGCDTFLFDLAVCLNDWCIDSPREAAFLSAYESVRTLTAEERRLLPALKRAAALRFWLSRLKDLHLPRQATLLKPHDPRHFESVLRQRIRQHEL